MREIHLKTLIEIKLWRTEFMRLLSKMASVILLVIVSATLLVGCAINSPQDGQKIGRIVKLSKSGFVYTTLEGELIRGGFSDGSGSMGGSFHFTIEYTRLKEIAYDALEKQYEVIIFYECPGICSFFRSEHGRSNFVTKIVKK